MEKIVLDNVYLRNIEDECLIDELYAKKLIRSIIKQWGLENYLNKIQFVDNNNKSISASYDFDNMDLKIAVDNILLSSFEDYNSNFEYQNNIDLFQNLYFLQVIFHELFHIYQNFLIHESDIGIVKLLLNDVNFLSSEKSSQEIYDKYYFNFPLERVAEISSTENILFILASVVSNRDIQLYFLKFLRNCLIDGYTISNNTVISPMAHLYNEVYKLDTPIIDNMSDYNRIKYGCDLSRDIYEQFHHSKSLSKYIK